ncbi:MAG: DNA-directed RNA polymerase subunit alpha C-terminal domain-containing protein [Planctomycetota bacterium]
MDQIDISQEMAAPEVQPSVSGHPQLDIARDEIPAFGTLQAARPGVYETNRSYDTFSRTVEAMSTAGEEGRRRGLGFWMLGRYDEAADALKSYTDDDVAMYTCGRSLVSAARPGEAVAIFEALSVKYPDEPRPKGDMLDAKLDADLVAGDVEAAITNLEASLAAQREPFHESAEGRHLRGRISELSGEYQDALEHFQAARAADPTHRRNLFHLAYLSERVGQEALALDAYETLATMLPVDRAVMINLGVLYEDLGRDQDAAACYDTIARTDPTDRFARLYLEDAKAGMSMYYDEDLEKKEDRLNQILRIPITDFELSVRARNCLNKMDIMTLGDLVKKTESELLSYKNFGETSLTEIKEILASKGLRLGMAREEAVASIAKARSAQEGRDLDPNDPRNKPISELKLSIRARRTVENLGCLTLGDITAHAEEELLGMPNFGVTSLLELRNRLAEYGLSLKGDD